MCGRLRFRKSFVDFFAHCRSELPCVRPLDAAQNGAAGHIAFRELGLAASNANGIKLTQDEMELLDQFEHLG
jgi:hypothetical protein